MPAPHTDRVGLGLALFPAEREGRIYTTMLTRIHPLSAAILAPLLLIGSALALPAASVAYRDADGYFFYEIWWEPYISDPETALLVHAGAPTDPARLAPGDAAVAAAEAAEAASEQSSDAELGALLLGDDGPPVDDIGGDDLKPKRNVNRPRDQVAPDDVLYDYSPGFGNFPVAEGVRKVADGRFGGGLAFDGTGGQMLAVRPVDDLHTMEAWYKPAALPEAPACLMASPPGGGSLWLYPDGTLELRWPSALSDQEARIRTERTIEPGRWTHIAAYGFRERHIEWVFTDGPKYEMRIGIDGTVAARLRHLIEKVERAGGSAPEPFIEPGTFVIGAAADGSAPYTGLIDEIRVAGLRRFLPPPDRDPDLHSDPSRVPFGPPRFPADRRLVHADFASAELLVAPEGAAPELRWDAAPHATLADVLLPGPVGTAVMVDPALPLLRIPVDGMSMREGSFECWFRPLNWDNFTDYGQIRDWSQHTMEVMRFMGRDTRSGEVVPFMWVTMARASLHGEPDWNHPGRWSHMLWTWSPEDVHQEDGWGDTEKGDPITTFRAWRGGDEGGDVFWRAQLKRDLDLIGKVTPLYLEIGIKDPVTVRYGQRPTIAVDEVIVHESAFDEDERAATHARWFTDTP